VITRHVPCRRLKKRRQQNAHGAAVFPRPCRDFFSRQSSNVARRKEKGARARLSGRPHRAALSEWHFLLVARKKSRNGGRLVATSKLIKGDCGVSSHGDPRPLRRSRPLLRAEKRAGGARHQSLFGHLAQQPKRVTIDGPELRIRRIASGSFPGRCRRPRYGPQGRTQMPREYAEAAGARPSIVLGERAVSPRRMRSSKATPVESTRHSRS